MKHELIDNVPVITLINENDLIDNSEINQIIENYIDQGYHYFVFDLSNLNFINSFSIGMIAKITIRLQKIEGKICIINRNEKVFQLFQLAELNKIIPIYDSIQSAIKVKE